MGTPMLGFYTKTSKSIKKTVHRRCSPDVFETLKSIGQVVLNNGEITLMESLDSQLSLESLAKYISRGETYRDVILYSCNTPGIDSANI